MATKNPRAASSSDESSESEDEQPQKRQRIPKSAAAKFKSQRSETSPKEDDEEDIKPNEVRDNQGDFELAYPKLWLALTTDGTKVLTHKEAKKLLSNRDSRELATLEKKFKKYYDVELHNHLRWLDQMKDTMKLIRKGGVKSD